MADIGAETTFPRVKIYYCTQCRWMLRAAWFAQELLTTFQESMGEVSLCPSTGGKFAVYLQTSDSSKEGVLVWDRKHEGRFPEAKELKQLIRNVIEPERDLGHSDKKSNMSRGKNVQDATIMADGPANTLSDKPKDSTSLGEAKASTQQLGSDDAGKVDGPATDLENKPSDASDSTQTNKAKTEDVACKTCE